MISRSINRPFLLRLIILLVFSAASAILFFSGLYVQASFCTLLLIIMLLEIMHFNNATNRKLTYFFEAIRNEDSTLHFPETKGDKFTNQFHSSLNRLNNLISEIKIRNERNELFYRELLRYSSTGIIALDEQGFIELINNAALRLIGMQNLANIKLLQQKRSELYSDLVSIQPGQTRTLKFLRDDELQHISVKVSQLNFGDKKFIVYSFYDIKTELEENEVESWQKLIRVLTHEIMNSVAPITSLSNTLQRLVKNGSGPLITDQLDKTREGLQVIEETGKGLMHFIDNYRKLTKIPKPVFKTINIKEWIDRILILMQEKFNDGKIKCTLQYKAMQQQLIADEKLMTQVMINILNNAADALTGSKAPTIKIKVYSNDTGKLIISITDNGKGIQKDELDKIFIPFYTTKENGSGIGLSLSRQIMRLHRAGINIRSLEGKQTTVTLNF